MGGPGTIVPPAGDGPDYNNDTSKAKEKEKTHLKADLSLL